MNNGIALREGARLRSGRYELDRVLGHGGAASVWLARDTLLERPVAVKLLSEGLAADRAWMARFRREARIAARLQHPNLVSIYDFDADAERPFLVMAYLPGGSLADRLENGGVPDPERLARDVLMALEHIHASGIVHRDVKPGNVLLDRDGRALLTDFGIARPEDATSITQAGQIPGTARYMAPELWRGDPAGERSDLFACGVLLAQCGAEESQSPRLRALVGRLAAEDPELRPRSAAEALAQLDRRAAEHAPAPAPTVASVPPREEPPPLAPRPGGGAPKRWPAIVGLAAVVLAAGVALASSVGGGDDGGSAGTAANSAQRADSAEGPNRDGGTGAQASGAGSSDSATETPVAETAGNPYALNDEGYRLIQEGSYDQAIPLLEQAVAGLEGSGDELTYGYALFNLGNALRLAGRPEEAIPILEKRMTIPDQLDTVAAELEQAREDAGLKGPKPKDE
jgi:eukaryotic-like serine/threonine-protein kinase